MGGCVPRTSRVSQTFGARRRRFRTVALGAVCHNRHVRHRSYQLLSHVGTQTTCRTKPPPLERSGTSCSLLFVETTVRGLGPQRVSVSIKQHRYNDRVHECSAVQCLLDPEQYPTFVLLRLILIHEYSSTFGLPLISRMNTILF